MDLKIHEIEINDIDMNKLALKPGFFQGKIAINRPVFIHNVADLQLDTQTLFLDQLFVFFRFSNEVQQRLNYWKEAR